MFVRMAWGKVQEGRWDEFATAYREGTAAAGRADGLVGRIFSRGIDEPDTAYAMSLWESTDAMEAYEAGPAKREVSPRIGPFVDGTFEIQWLEVVFEERYDEDRAN